MKDPNFLPSHNAVSDCKHSAEYPFAFCQHLQASANPPLPYLAAIIIYDLSLRLMEKALD